MAKVVVIFGASSGIGLAAAKLFLSKNCKVYACQRTLAAHSGIINYTVDIVDANDVKNALQNIFKKENRIDIIINCAGFSFAAPVEFTLTSDSRHLFNVNFFGAAEVIKLALPFLTKGARIINISSIAACLPVPYDAFYNASKAALNALTQSLHFELKPKGILATSLMAGGTATPFTKKRKLYKNIGEYQQATNNAYNQIAAIEQGGMTAQAVANKIYRLAKRKNPPTIAVAGFFNNILYLFSKILPSKLLLWLLKMKFRV
jgi:short-subunit dehydrogenase